MTDFETVVSPERFDPTTIEGPWILILGGVGRTGNRRARRFVAAALDDGLDVVWLDGFEESAEEDPGQRVPLEKTPPSGRRVYVVGYHKSEMRLIYNRIAIAISRMVYSTGSGAAELLSTSESERIAHLGRRIRRISRRVGNALFNGFFGRVASALRGRGGYRILRSTLRDMAKQATPAAIVYCDDHALTLAWHCARLWPDVRVASEWSGP